MFQGKCWTPWTKPSWKSQSCTDICCLHDIFLNLRYLHLGSMSMWLRVWINKRNPPPPLWYFDSLFCRKIWSCVCIHTFPHICSTILCSLWPCVYVFYSSSIIFILFIYIYILKSKCLSCLQLQLDCHFSNSQT